MNTIFLNPATWGLCLDAAGNIALATEPYAVAQDVSSACKLFRGELWYDTSQGVPLLQSILGKQPSQAFLNAQYQAAALSVPDVAAAQCVITSLTNRRATGAVQFTLTDGGKQVVGF